MAKREEEESMSPEERRLKIEEDYKAAQAMATRVNILSTYLDMGLPIRTALKHAGIKLSDSEIKAIEKNRAKKAVKKKS